jgi:hypothetical protein
MEGRLMLSGDAPNYELWDTYSPEFSAALFPLGAMPLNTFPAVDADGGFILPGTVLTGYSVRGSFDPATNRAYIGSFAPSTPTPPGVSVSVFDHSDVDFGGVYLDTPAVPLIEFPGTDSNPGTTFVDQPVDAGPQVTETFADEGGAIPINSILAFVGHTDSWTSGEQLASNSTSHASERLPAIPILGQPARAMDIAGEWARPTMLEMAGGEPASIQHAAAPEHEQTLFLEKGGGPLVRRPLSSGAAADAANNSRAARDDDASRRGADTVPSDDSDGANVRSRAASQQPESLIHVSHIADADPQNHANALAMAELTNVGDAASKTGAVNASARAEVYDELGASEAAGAEALFNRDSWRDSWKATPLLLILALERIAASNSRRAKREVPESAGRPRPNLPDGSNLPEAGLKRV